MSEGSGEKELKESEEKVCEGNIELSRSSLLHPSGTMGQGVYVRGVVAKGIIPVTIEKSNRSQPSGQERESERAQVTHVIPETPRSMPGQGEVRGNAHGGPKLR